ncbi:hypothetical protein N7448_001463 [Penicillium atrosanguineum]|uniref:Uncharacterized protein n=1 Tax=Penicillium atrosanguineum TaxID=1132637 RepID=A0A9W9U8D5_9EURO|nr:uncharacterized protein N7443_004860 [Penicillium atrosanguineum]KAJ5133510.1 hypothetical protein N7526_004875 [Penicillium atrosanguineum]KAJ5149885.1 hypothetical protein N7448_001463 [Penicillium atrosanguineum]KAJ5305200.1 hypothetical protein N7443_004860 [Penicillium atrosanguineum]KAJ5324665.1 hypothetical protein N7476_003265 [Penicillium atrosanguineum]
MSLFRTNLPASDGFSSLFRLLDDYDHHRTGQQQSALRITPRFDVRESNDSYHLDGELPGIAQSDIDIEFSDPQTLVVKGRTERSYKTEPQDQVEEEESSNTVTETAKTKTTSKPDSKTIYWANERVVGEFQRTFSFAQRVDQDAVKASLKNGILSISVPKAAAASVKKITID